MQNPDSHPYYLVEPSEPVRPEIHGSEIVLNFTDDRERPSYRLMGHVRSPDFTEIAPGVALERSAEVDESLISRTSARRLRMEFLVTDTASAAARDGGSRFVGGEWLANFLDKNTWPLRVTAPLP